MSGLSFQPGQWVDFHAPGVKHVGGYSICSTPQELQSWGLFELCVKASRHPCAQWVHQQAAPGDTVSSMSYQSTAQPGYCG
jgi:ferredoxin-NADP reductase